MSVGGACFGGVIAFEMARQLRSQGEKIIRPLMLFDSFLMNNPYIQKEEEHIILQYADTLPPETLRDRIPGQFTRSSQLGLMNVVRYVESDRVSAGTTLQNASAFEERIVETG
jgi:thioesterase domain-containing protein